MNKKARNNKSCSIGIISDTHGLLRPEAADALQGSDLIIHAGDIGEHRIIDELEIISPVLAVRGNMDHGSLAQKLKMTEAAEVSGHLLHILHDVSRLDIDPASAHIKAVIYGHSHRPSIHDHEGILYINPGSAGPRRFKLPVTVAALTIIGDKLNAEIIKLKV